MHGAGAGGAAGQDLAALGDEAAQLGGVLVVNMLALVHAELADLLALPGRGGASGTILTFHSHGTYTSYQNVGSDCRSSQEQGSEGQIAVLVVNLREAGAVAGGGAVAAGSTIASGGLSAIGGGGVGRGTSVAVAGAVALAVGEVDVVGHHLGTAAVVAVPVLPGPELQPPLGHGHAALGEILADELRRLPPGHNVNEIRALRAGIA